MKRLFCCMIAIVLLFSTNFVVSVSAEVETVTVPVTVSGVYKGVNDWANSTYTYTVTDGVPADNGILSNGKYTFMYYPKTGQIMNTAPATSFAFLPGFSGIPIIIPSRIGAFTVGTDSYAEKPIELYAAALTNAIFVGNLLADEDIIIPEGVESIPNYVFSSIPNSNEKVRFILPSTLKTIGDYAFKGLSGGGTIHKNVIIPDGVTSIGVAAFNDCKFTDAVIPAGVTLINATSFGYMYNLKNVTISGEVTSIGANAFRNDSGIRTLIFKGKTAPKTISTSAFQGLAQEYTVYYPPDGIGYGEGSPFRTTLGMYSSSIIYKKGTPTSSELTSIAKTDTGYNVGYKIVLGIDESNHQIANTKNMVALYHDNTLVALKLVDNNETTVQIATDKKVTLAKLFTWDNNTNIMPISKMKSLPTVYNRGVNIAGAEFGGTTGSYTWNNEETFKYFAEKGFNIIRVPLKWERLQPVLFEDFEPGYLNGLKQNIAWAKKYGARVIIDIHNYGTYNSGVIGVSPDVPISSFADLWVRLSNEFKDESGVYAYDLMNEPHGMGTGENDWKVISQAMVTAIRNNSDNTLIMVEGLSYANAGGWEGKNGTKTSWISDPADNFMYSAHCYFDSNASGTYAKSYSNELSLNSDLNNVGVIRVMDFITWCKENNVRSFVGEFGVPNSDPRWNIALENFMKVLDENGLDATCWAGGSWWNSSYPLSLQPKDNYTTDRPQMSVLEKHLSQN